MHKVIIPVALLITMLFISCNHPFKFHSSDTINSNFPLIFSTSPSSDTNLPIACDYQLRAKATGDTLFLAMRLKNDSPDNLIINPGDIQISSSTGVKSDIIDTGYHQYTVNAHSDTILTFKFSPVQNQQLYQSTGYKGDMDSVYYLNCSFINNGRKMLTIRGGMVKFQIDRKSYVAYKLAFGVQSTIKVYHLTNQQQVEQAISTSLNQRHLTAPGDVRVSSNIISIGGLIIKLNPYRTNSQLHLQLQIINHGRYVVKLNPVSFKIKLQSGCVSPQVLNAANNIALKKNETYYISKAGRFDAQLQYNLEAPDNFLLICAPIWLPSVNDERDHPVELNFAVAK